MVATSFHGTSPFLISGMLLRVTGSGTAFRPLREGRAEPGRSAAPSFQKPFGRRKNKKPRAEKLRKGTGRPHGSTLLFHSGPLREKAVFLNAEGRQRLSRAAQEWFSPPAGRDLHRPSPLWYRHGSYSFLHSLFLYQYITIPEFCQEVSQTSFLSVYK